MSSSAVIPSLDFNRFKAVLFDVDGTLYDQRQLRRKMAMELALFYLFRPWRFREASVISTFRRLREERFEWTDPNLVEAQYLWTADALKLKREFVQTVVEEWIFRRPLKHLLECRPEGLAELFDRIRSKGLKIGVFSDYPVDEKLAALQLRADATACATDCQINRFKPDPAGLLHLCQRLGVKPGECLHIGDREDRDAICSERSGCLSLILPAHHARKLGREQSFDLLFGSSRFSVETA